ncbi:hypothetical protein SAMN04487895_108202 [Paenibacillus sophorae]|uniref:Uncharacterized protein n=1 Tax=Paenibacillus sophorae TaxID=1333845 RepID=A0A1H8QFQ8_9BACL|nr:hypothetical protein SAMN04487895_108202 [Paenibacillus sophorae]
MPSEPGWWKPAADLHEAHPGDGLPKTSVGSPGTGPLSCKRPDLPVWQVEWYRENTSPRLFLRRGLFLFSEGGHEDVKPDYSKRD